MVLYKWLLFCNIHLFNLSSSVQLLISVWLIETPWTADARPPCPSPTLGVFPLTSIKLVMPYNHLILCHPLLLLPSIPPSIRVFPNESALHIKWPSIEVSASASVLPMNIQDWFPLDRLVGSPCCPRNSQVFSNTTVQTHQFFSTHLSL